MHKYIRLCMINLFCLFDLNVYYKLRHNTGFRWWRQEIFGVVGMWVANMHLIPTTAWIWSFSGYTADFPAVYPHFALSGRKFGYMRKLCSVIPTGVVISEGGRGIWNKFIWKYPSWEAGRVNNRVCAKKNEISEISKWNEIIELEYTIIWFREDNKKSFHYSCWQLKDIIIW